jgi:hypothetical protein
MPLYINTHSRNDLEVDEHPLPSLLIQSHARTPFTP